MPHEYRKKIALCLIFAVMVIIPINAYASNERVYPGDQWPAENFQLGLSSDVFVEKHMDSIIYPFEALFNITGIATNSIIAGSYFKKLIVIMGEKYIKKYGVKSVIGAGAIEQSSRAGVASATFQWMNWPPRRYIFDNAEMSGINFISGSIADAIGSTLNGLANLIFVIPKACVLMANNIIVLAFDNTWVEASADWISDTANEMGGSFTGAGQNQAMSLLFIICLCALAVFIALNIMRGQLVKAGTSVLIAALSVAGTFLYIANSHNMVTTVAEFTDGVAGVAMSATSTLDPDTKNYSGNDLSSVEKGMIVVTNNAWNAIIATPWAWGQFGTADVTKLKISKNEVDSFKVTVKGGNPASGVGRLLESNELDESFYIDTLYLGSEDRIRGELLKVLSDPKIKHGDHPMTVAAISPSYSSFMYHIFISIMTLVPAIAYLLLAIFLAVPVILAQVAIMIMLVFLPLGIIAGVAGEQGQQFCLAYIKRLAGFFAVKIVYGFYLSLVLFTANLIM